MIMCSWDVWLKKMKPILSLLILFSLLVPSPGSSATITCACTQAGVSAAINSAANGDTVQCSPAGQSASWSTAITIPSSKGITLDGNGATINGRINLNQNSNTSTRITRFTFTNDKAIKTSGS